MSATINAEHFSNYFGVCPMLNIPGMTFPVTEYYLEDVISNLNFQFENDEVTGRGNSRYGSNAGWFDREYEIYLQDYVRRCLRDRTKFSVSTINQIMKPQSEKFESLMVLCGVLVEKITKLDQNNGAILVFVTGIYCITIMM
jgi:ATP-dependent RNA helicase DHX36